MEQRKIIDAKVRVDIPIERAETYKQRIMWGDLIKTPGILPTDTLIDISYRTEEESVFGRMDDGPLGTLYFPAVTVIRMRPETDEEFLIRVNSEEKEKREKDEKDKLEYLRLKAKFEPQQ